MKKNAFGFYEEINEDAIKVLRSMLKNKKVRYFIVMTYPFEYTISKIGADLENCTYIVGKETGYKYIKKKFKTKEEVLDFFINNNEAIAFIKKTDSEQDRRGAISFYERPFGQIGDEVREELLEKRPKQINLPEKDICVICHDELSDGRPICKPITCDHIFHCDCMSRIHPNKDGELLCPICRHDTYGRSEPLQYVSNRFGKKRTKRTISSKRSMKSLLNDIKTLKNL